MEEPTMNTFICNSCKESKLQEQFFKDRSKPNGIRTQCKECTKKAYEIQAAKRPPIPVSHATCSKCGETKEYEMFHKDSKKPKGIRSRCKACCLVDVQKYTDNHRTEIIEKKGNVEKTQK